MAMIMFNIACVVVFRVSDRRIDRMSRGFEKAIRKQVEDGEASEKEKKYLLRKLKRVANLRAFERTLQKIEEENPELVYSYLETASSVFMELSEKYSRKNALEAAFFPYLIREHGLFRGRDPEPVIRMLLDMVRNQSLYCRENAMEALYSIGNAKAVLAGLTLLDRSDGFHHAKMISDGLLDFAGDRNELDELLWKHLPSFSEAMQVALLDYFRFSSGDHKERMLEVMTSEDTPDELRYSCIRYFGRHRYEQAYEKLLHYARITDRNKWEYPAIAATALAGYPGEKTVGVLKGLLESSSWHVRYNASQSLEILGFEYMDMIDIIESDDRYASEMIRYRLNQRNLKARRRGSDG